MSFVWKPGMRAKCIKEGGWSWVGTNTPATAIKTPLKDAVYIVREVYDKNDIFLRFNEIWNPTPPGCQEPSFHASQFIPIEEKEDRIEQFRRLVTPEAIAGFIDPYKKEEEVGP